MKITQISNPSKFNVIFFGFMMLAVMAFMSACSSSSYSSNSSQKTQTLEEFQQARAQWELEHGKKWTLGDATFKE